MDTGRHENYIYYKGYEGEPELLISISASSSERYHIWEGYIDDIFGEAIFTEDGWNGLTRDYQLLEGPFEESNEFIVDNMQEYYDDLQSYLGKEFRYPESADVLCAMLAIFKEAMETNKTVVIECI